MSKHFLALSVFMLSFAGSLLAQLDGTSFLSKPLPLIASDKQATALGPEMTLQRYVMHSREQSFRLPSYESYTVVHAELPDTAQQGEYELIASYTAMPRSLRYSSVHFEGDRFVKSTVIVKLLQSDVEHVRQGDSGATEISEQNYKFCYEGTEQVHDRQAHVFHVKPRRKVPGLFKGQIFLDANSGSMVRMEGTLVKSPSFFVRDIKFVQDFEEVQGYTLPTELRTSAQARILGRIVVNVIHRSYSLHSNSEIAQEGQNRRSQGLVTAQ